MPIKVTGLNTLARELEQASAAIGALEGPITEVRYDPEDPSSVEAAIAQAEAAIDLKIAPYRGNKMVEQLAASMKTQYRAQILDRAAQARMDEEWRASIVGLITPQAMQVTQLFRHTATQ